MRIEMNKPSKTKAVLNVTATQDELNDVKRQVLSRLTKDVKVSGFRPGKAPLELAEKQLDQKLLQQEFLEEAVQQLYPVAAKQESIRPVDRPEIAIKAFVPFTELSFEATVDVLGDVSLPDYTKIKKDRKTAKVTEKDVDEVIENLRAQTAEKLPVKRAAKNGDQLTIDFSGKDKTGEPVKGADGKSYPLTLGSKSFIPGFEENLLGLKSGDTKTFDVTFPKDYGVTSLAGEKVTFSVDVKEVNELKKPEVNDEFAASVGPVKTVADLKRDIKKELMTEKQRQADLQFESELVAEITKKSKLDIPEILIEDQLERMLNELKQNLSYRGQTIKEFLDAKQTTEEQYKEKELKPQAEERVKASIVLAEIAEKEKIEVTPEELEIRMQVLKGQYTDPQMQAELSKPEAKQNIASRMLSEKTVAQLAAYATKK